MTKTFEKAGDRFGDYVAKQVKEIPEIYCSLLELEHIPTGAQILQLANDDDENLFNLSFRTHPDSSNGVAHILEHTVLCGSKKYPVRDPFFSMTRRSLNTFMNALTGPDFTCYPASSMVPKDFYNLLEVYLDAVFHPNLTYLSFLQEGHRLEFLKPDDPNTPLVFKGIVFNEMKGALSSSDARLTEALMHAIYPDLTYGVNSGGDPKEIVNLTYEQLKEFHGKYYHPSRCLFFFYGNLPIERHLNVLDKHAFAGVQKAPQLPYLPKQPRFSEKRVTKSFYPVHEGDETADKMMLGMGWLTCSILEQEDLLALSVLEVVISGTDASPLKMALLRSGLCKQADTTIDGELSEVPFVVICKGCAENTGEALENVVRTTFEKLAKEGLPSHLVDAAIHQIEMARTEITGNSSPYGLSLFWRSALLKQHGGNPEDGLKVHTLFNQLREKVKDPGYFPSLIQKYFLKNPHFVRVEMHPDPTLGVKELALEEEKLVQTLRSFNDEDVKQLLQQTKELEDYQESSSEEHIDTLPKVTLKDVQREGKEFPLIRKTYGNIELFTHSCFTNGLTYTDLVFDLPYLEEKDLSLVRLFSLLLPQMGSGGRSYEQQLEYLLEHTGGLSASLDLCTQADDSAKMLPSLILRGKALNRKLDKLFPTIKDLIVSVDFTDAARLKELLMQHLHGLESSIQNSSMRYAVNLAARGYSVASKIGSQWYGLDYFWWLKEVVKGFEQNPQTLIENLQRMQSTCMGSQGAHLVLSCDSDALETLEKHAFYGLTEIPTRNLPKWDAKYPLDEKKSQGRITASPVAFTAMMLPGVSYVHPQAAALSITSEIIENTTLHKKIREQGGAYGCGAVNALLSEQFYFYSYRDPHIKSTLKAFQESVTAIANKKFKTSDIEEAKLGLFQDLDAPTPPASRAMTAYSRWRGGRTPERRQAFREALFSADKDDIQQAAKDILIPALEESVTVSFASKDLLEKENALLKEKALPLYPIS